jgi:hypothetical protein
MEWILSLSSEKQWDFVGVLGVEERSLCSWHLNRGFGVLKDELIVQVGDANSWKYEAQTKEALEIRYEEYINKGGIKTNYEQLKLMSELFLIQELADRAVDMGSSIILDVTSMPKRFFFPILRKLLLADSVENLLVTYASPSSYTDDVLYEDIDIWKNLPGFGGGVTEKETLIVSIGFLVESLNRYLSDNPDHGKVKMLIPFPASLAVLRRTWNSVADLENGQDNTKFEKYRVDTLDMSVSFDHIKSLADNSSSPIAFAPFGPKPISMAMCIYASQANSSVYYPQPTIYHPEYSKGIKDDDPHAAVSGYWVKHEGENLYSITDGS